MAEVFVEPEPKGLDEGKPILYYALESADGSTVTGIRFFSLQAAVKAAKRLGHEPLIARVRNASKSNPSHWIPA